MKIGVIGSMHQTTKMLAICRQLETLGHETFISAFAEAYIDKNPEEIEELKLHHKYHCDAIRDFWRQMQGADAVLAVNVGRDQVPGYIGANTFAELIMAHILDQQIYLLYPHRSDGYIDTELAAMQPTVLNSDLTQIPLTQPTP